MDVACVRTISNLQLFNVAFIGTNLTSQRAEEIMFAVHK